MMKYKPYADPTDIYIGKPSTGMQGKAKSSIGPVNSSIEKNDCEHDYKFKYMKEKVTEKGDIIRQDHYFCRHCLEEKVIESE